MRGRRGKFQAAGASVAEGLRALELACGFDQLELVAGVNLTLLPSHCLHLSGANGSGKTTLLRTLAGILPALRGSITWQGTSINAPNSCYWQESLYLGHQDALYPNLSAAENLRWYLRMEGARASAAELEDLLGLFDLDGEQLAAGLSFGQRRQVQLARLLAGLKQLWLLDEPFNGLDQRAQQTLSSGINRHCAAGGSCIFSSHQAPPVGLEVTVALTL